MNIKKSKRNQAFQIFFKNKYGFDVSFEDIPEFVKDSFGAQYPNLKKSFSGTVASIHLDFDKYSEEELNALTKDIKSHWSGLYQLINTNNRTSL